jgi:hypothetical protein
MLPSLRIAVATLVFAAAAYLYGLGSLHAPGNGDELIYAQITRATAASGRWLPLESEMADMVNTKPPLLFWQGIASTDWARRWTLLDIRWPSLGWTFLTALLVGLATWRASDRDLPSSLLAPAIYLAFLSTFRYGRPFLTNPPETFWVFLCFFLLVWWRPSSFSSRLLFPTLIGIVTGSALLTKSFAQLLPIGLGLAVWHLHEHDWDLRRFVLRSLPGLIWTAAVSLAIFSLWFLLDPDPAAIWREFVVGENMGKLRAGRSNYLAALLWGRVSIWTYFGGWFTNAGLLALPLLGTVIRAWQHRGEARADERLWWSFIGIWFLVFLLPTQRSGRYLLEAMPAVAILMAIHWRRLLPSAFATTIVAAGAVVGLTGWLSWLLVRSLPADAFPPTHWLILAGAAAIVIGPLVRRAWLPVCAVPATLAAGLAVSSLLAAFDPPVGGFPAEAVAAARGRTVWAPQNFRAAAEIHSFLLPGSIIRGYPATADGPDPALVGEGDLVVLVRPLGRAAPPGAIGSRLDLATRHTVGQLREMLAGRVAEHLFVRAWLVRSDQ